MNWKHGTRANYLLFKTVMYHILFFRLSRIIHTYPNISITALWALGTYILGCLHIYTIYGLFMTYSVWFNSSPICTTD